MSSITSLDVAPALSQYLEREVEDFINELVSAISMDMPSDITKFVYEWTANKGGYNDICDNIILLTDAHKPLANLDSNNNEIVTHYLTIGRTHETPLLFFGVQYISARFLSGTVLTAHRIAEVEEIMVSQKESEEKINFIRARWEYILNHHEGYLPILIEAIPEGTCIQSRESVVVLSISNTDPKCSWLVPYLHSIFLQLNHLSGVASSSFQSRKTISTHLRRNSVCKNETEPRSDGRVSLMSFSTSPCISSASLSATAHSIVFPNADLWLGTKCAKTYYNNDNTSKYDRTNTWNLWTASELFVIQEALSKSPDSILLCVSNAPDIFTNANFQSTYEKMITFHSGNIIELLSSCLSSQVLISRIMKEIFTQLTYTCSSTMHRILNDSNRVLIADNNQLEFTIELLDQLNAQRVAAENCYFMTRNIFNPKSLSEHMRLSFVTNIEKLDCFEKCVSLLDTNNYKVVVKLEGSEHKTIIDSLPEKENQDSLSSQIEKSLLIPVLQDGRLLLNENFTNIVARVNKETLKHH